MDAQDTIVARASAPGRGGVGVVRLSGPLAKALADKITKIKLLKPRYAHFAKFFDGESLIDTGLCLYFPAPHSYTGETVVEFQCHGGPVIIDRLIETCLKLGAVFAKPGEFTQRAYLNKKLDLAQAEAVADLIDASSTQAALAAQQSLNGVFSQKVYEMDEKIVHLRMYVEAAIDFAEEEIDFLSGPQVKQQFVEVERLFSELLRRTQQGVMLQEGKTLAIIGAPNAGKSSLLNYWAGEEAAIVTEVAGTTRDMISREVSLDGIRLNLLDTAGLRLTDERIEQEGISRALKAMETAQKILWIIDDSDQDHLDFVQARLEPFGNKLLKIYNKIDISGHPSGIHQNAAYLCAKTGEGFSAFLSWLKHHLGVEHQEGAFMARRRHLDALFRCESHLNKAKVWIKNQTGELLAEELKLASQALQTITGQMTPDELLGKIFSNFCIGK